MGKLEVSQIDSCVSCQVKTFRARNCKRFISGLDESLETERLFDLSSERIAFAFLPSIDSYKLLVFPFIPLPIELMSLHDE